MRRKGFVASSRSWMPTHCCRRWRMRCACMQQCNKESIKIINKTSWLAPFEHLSGLIQRHHLLSTIYSQKRLRQVRRLVYEALWRIYCGHTRQTNCKWLQDSCDNSFVDDEEKKGGENTGPRAHFYRGAERRRPRVFLRTSAYKCVRDLSEKYTDPKKYRLGWLGLWWWWCKILISTQ